MSTKTFCDLCGKPALDPSFESIRFDTKPGLNRTGYFLCVEFTEARKYHPTIRDERRDCCAKCMADGLRQIIKKLDGK